MLTRRSFILSASALVLATPVRAATRPVFAVDGIALRGTDPVAYFSDGAPTQGSSAHEFDWNGAVWRFVSAANRDAFVKDPDGYAPQYGGYCAWAVSRNYTAATVPEAWHIHEGRLFLNYSLSVRKRWRRDVVGNVAKADANWPRVLQA